MLAVQPSAHVRTRSLREFMQIYDSNIWLGCRAIYRKAFISPMFPLKFKIKISAETEFLTVRPQSPPTPRVRSLARLPGKRFEECV